MKEKTVNFWIFKAVIPCAILCFVFAMSANAFHHSNEILFDTFIILLSLSFGAMCISSYLCVYKGVTDISDEIGAAHSKGIPTKKLVWPFVCLALAAIVFSLCLYLDATWMHATLPSLATFLLLTFAPILFDKQKKTIGKEKPATIPTINNSEANHTEIDTDNAEAEDNFIDDDTDITSVIFPANFPKELNSHAIKILFIELGKAQILDKNFQPLISSKTQQALLIDAISEIFDIKNKWQVFEPFWNTTGMKSLLSQVKKAGQNDHLDYEIYRAFANALQYHQMQSKKSFKNWVDTYERRHLS